MGNLKTGYIIPADDQLPEDDYCLQVYIPHNTDYLIQFFTMLGMFGKWNSWKHSDAVTEKQVADRWKTSIERAHSAWAESGGCEVFDVRQNPDAPCELDKSTDGGETWAAWANLQLCPPIVAINTSTGKPNWWNPAAGGGTGAWEDIPTGFIPGEAYPPVHVPFPAGSTRYEDDTARCFAAANMIAELKRGVSTLVGDWELVLGGGALLLEGLFAIMLFTPAGAILELMALITGMTFGISSATASAGFDAINWPNVRDHAACYFTRDGVLTESGKASLLTWMGTQYSGNIAWQMAQAIVNGVTAAGLTSDGGIPQTDLSIACADDFCPVEWDSTLDFTISNLGFSGYGIGVNDPYGVYESGVGWHNRPGGAGECQIILAISTAHVTHVEMTVSSNAGDPSAAILYGSTYVVPVDFDLDMTYIRIVVYGLSYGTQYTISGAFIRGTGVKPPELP